jgi:hypothetical protein
MGSESSARVSERLPACTDTWLDSGKGGLYFLSTRLVFDESSLS